MPQKLTDIYDLVQVTKAWNMCIINAGASYQWTWRTYLRMALFNYNLISLSHIADEWSNRTRGVNDGSMATGFFLLSQCPLSLTRPHKHSLQDTRSTITTSTQELRYSPDIVRFMYLYYFYF